MTGARAVRVASAENAATRLFERIGEFLSAQRLEPVPANYAVAYYLLSDPDGPLARAVATLTDGGVRLTQRDFEELGASAPAESSKAEQEKAQGLVAQTQMHVEGFEDMVQAIRDETAGFGRDLAESAAAIDRSRLDADDGAPVDEVARITAAMIARVRTAEERLDSATREASELRKKLEEARDNARRDPLTGLPNRRAFEEAYATQAAAGAAICMAVCDVDHFKSVNDRFGHAVGDRVLKAIAEALAESCQGHLVARYGGEEFAILFAGVDIEHAHATLDRARDHIAAKRYRLRESDEPLGAVTFSAGLAQGAAGEAYHEMFQRADSSLYQAKSDGRNCVRRA